MWAGVSGAFGIVICDCHRHGHKGWSKNVVAHLVSRSMHLHHGARFVICRLNSTQRLMHSRVELRTQGFKVFNFFGSEYGCKTADNGLHASNELIVDARRHVFAQCRIQVVHDFEESCDERSPRRFADLGLFVLNTTAKIDEVSLRTLK